MPTPSIVFLDVDSEDVSKIHAKYPDAIIHGSGLTGQELIDACKDAAVISIFITTKFSAEILTQLPNLKLLCTRSVGYDHIDINYCDEHGITVCNVPDYGSHVIAEHVFALLLGTMRYITEGHRRVKEGMFDYHGLRGMALQGKTLGIVGTGKIGRKVVKIAHGFGMKIVAYDVFKVQELCDEFGLEYVELSDLLMQSDIITLHAPSLPATKHMINAQTIAQMKDGVIIVNTARGSLIDTDALLVALDSGKIRMALLDVLEHEANVETDSRLVHHPKVVTTPHIAFYADDSVHTMYTDCFTSIDEWLTDGIPTHTVKPVHVILSK
jgi:D-lactate dehydrogenase